METRSDLRSPPPTHTGEERFPPWKEVGGGVERRLQFFAVSRHLITTKLHVLAQRSPQQGLLAWPYLTSSTRRSVPLYCCAITKHLRTPHGVPTAPSFLITHTHTSSSPSAVGPACRWPRHAPGASPGRRLQPLLSCCSCLYCATLTCRSGGPGPAPWQPSSPPPQAQAGR